MNPETTQETHDGAEEILDGKVETLVGIPEIPNKIQKILHWLLSRLLFQSLHTGISDTLLDFVLNISRY